MSSLHRTFYATLSGILLILPWYEVFSGLWACIALVPLLLLEENFRQPANQKTRNFLPYAALTFIIWNAGTTWWIANATVAGALAAILINTLLFSLVFYAYHLTTKIAGKSMGNIALVMYWVSFEYLYLNAEISWPWLNLGNAFAHDTRLVQWYEYTGSLGGSVWILIVNLLTVWFIKKILSGEGWNHLVKPALILVLTFIIPLTLSEARYRTYQEVSDPCKVVITQPNIDPYNNSISLVDQCANLTKLADSLELKSANYMVAPEVAIRDDVWENSITDNYSIPYFRKFLSHYPGTSFIYGSYTFKKFQKNEPLSPTAQHSKFLNYYFDSYNSAVQIDSTRNIQLYHKSKLVIGVEKMPYQKTLKFLQNLVEGLGGSFASHGTQEFRSVFSSSDKHFRVAPVICYESVYGEYVTDYIKNGANLIFVITNDGWWGNTPGHIQHLGYSRLRAIETRRSIARSANTGISAFIDQRGDVIKSLRWDKRGTISCSINANSYHTFYVKRGDYIGKIAFLLSACILLFAAVRYFLNRNR